MSEKFSYSGQELDLFSEAQNWKKYFHRFLKPYIRGDVLEVGAGIGETTKYLHHHVHSWTCLEPDEKLAEQCRKNLEHLSPSTTIKTKTIEQLGDQNFYDCILYVDVLEHISDDKKEIQMAAQHLKPEGVLMILSPAHSFLYSSFDQAIGHFRRYNRASLKALTPADLELHHLFYLDSAGMLASLSNRIFLRQSVPTLKQIHVWDRVLIPISKILDPILGYHVGKSILGVWEKRTTT